MATYPKIADNQMNYFQYKAHQAVLFKEDDRKWQAFCKQIAPECAACLLENAGAKEAKDIGIQTASRKPIIQTSRTNVESKNQNKQVSEALNKIHAQLGKIGFALSKTHETARGEKLSAAPTLYEEEKLKSLEEQRRRFLIQNSLKASLQKLHISPSVIPKKSAIKPKNSSYFIPYDLQAKRAAARKAYLLSLQTKPKVSFRDMSQISKKNHESGQTSVPNKTSKFKSKKKGIIKKGIKKSSIDQEETLISSSEADEAKDENIELVIDGIVEDLMGEVALDLNKIKHRKKERESKSPNNEADVNKTKETTTCLNSITPSSTSQTRPNLTEDDNSAIVKLKLFMDSHKKRDKRSENMEKEMFIDKSTNTIAIEDSKTRLSESATKNKNIGAFYKKFPEIKNPPKFVCGVSSIITVDKDAAMNISQNKKRYWEYLKKIDRRAKGNFNPWIFNATFAESILDECISDIAEELSELPSHFIHDLYNQEFFQQVED